MDTEKYYIHIYKQEYKIFFEEFDNLWQEFDNNLLEQ